MVDFNGLYDVCVCLIDIRGGTKLDPGEALVAGGHRPSERGREVGAFIRVWPEGEAQVGQVLDDNF
jgi:hypothetical protein